MPTTQPSINDILSVPLRALPAYFGGKRKLVEDIFEDVLSMKGKTIVDPMGGSMVIPLAAKHLGFKVVCNDRMIGPYTIAKALVENNKTLIDLNKVASLIVTSDHDKFIETTYGGVHLPFEIARQADNIYGNIQKLPTQDQAPYLLMLYRYLTFMAPYQQYRYKKLVKQFYDGSYFDSMKHHIERWNKHIADPIPTLTGYATEINGAICSGTGQVFNDDVFVFLDRKIPGDILYLDPPYFGATLSYEASYGVIDTMMRRTVQPLTTSVFNKRADERQALLDLFQHIERFKLCIFSYWSKEHNTEWFETLFIEAGLNFVNKQVDHQYVYSTKKGVNNSQAGVRTEWTGDQRKQAGQQEILYFLKAK